MNAVKREMVRHLRAAGATHVRTGKHEIWRLNGRTIVVSQSPSDRRSIQNNRRLIAKACR